MPTITIPDKSVVNIGRGGKYGALPVEWSRVPQNVLDHIWETYSAQYITDASNSGGTESTGEDRDRQYAAHAKRYRRAEIGQRSDPAPLTPNQHVTCHAQSRACANHLGRRCP